jgi:hypothetical protein
MLDGFGKFFGAEVIKIGIDVSLQREHIGGREFAS